MTVSDGEWFTEYASPAHRLQWKVRGTLFRGQSAYQTIEVLDTEQFGPTLVLDGILQTATGDEFIYHEMLAHIPLSVHRGAARVLIVGGGDGGLAREVLRWPVDQVTMVEIDPMVVDVSRRFLPEHARAFDDPRLTLVFRDGFQYVREAAAESFDVVLVDSTDPEGGPGQVLYSAAFHRDVARILKPGGLYAQHAGAPFYNPDVLETVSRQVADAFSRARVFWCAIPTYPGGLFTFVVGSHGPDPKEPRRTPPFETRWYSPGVHRAAFQLSPWLEARLPQALVGEARAEAGEGASDA
jgi:spermidine synthase